MNVLGTLKSLVALESEEVLALLAQELRKLGYAPQEAGEFVYAEGDVPVLLVAHADTVYEGKKRRLAVEQAPDRKKMEVYYDRQRGCLWSPHGLGADDRAGVAAILEVLREGYRPSVLLTDGEESGGWGAEAAASALRPRVKLVIELDRRGKGQAVYYDCANADLEEYITALGFQTERGIFTDISILCPKWGIAGVNLSIGYYNEHSTSEYFLEPSALYTIERVMRLLDEAKHLPHFRYIRRQQRYY